jgi:hypothetical protein
MPKGLLKKTALFFAEKSGGIDLDLIAIFSVKQES